MPEYSESVQYQARNLWTLGFSDEDVVQVLERTGISLSVSTVQNWRTRKMPDGETSWRELRQISQLGHETIRSLKDTAQQRQMLHNVAAAGSEIMAIAQRALLEEPLYTESGKEVTELYTSEGDAVPIGSFQPRDFRELRAALTTGSTLVQRGISAIRRLDESERTEQQIMMRAMESLVEMLDLTDAQLETIRAVQTGAIGWQQLRQMTDGGDHG